jgi:hypothetical protein
MVEETITDPSRIAALLRAEIEGLADPPFGAMTVEPATGEPGTPTFRVSDEDGTVLTATAGPERLAVEVRRDPEAVAAATASAGLQARPKASSPPATVLLVGQAAGVKRVIDVLRATDGEQ